jgi:PAS domain-containing protein
VKTKIFAEPIRSSGGTQQILRQIADTAPMWMTDADDRCIYRNPAAQTMSADDDMIDFAAWARFIHPDDVRRAYAVFGQAKESLREYQIGYRIIRSVTRKRSLRLMPSVAHARPPQRGTRIRGRY